MPEITNPQAVWFANARIRVAADALECAYRTAKQLHLEYYADPSLGATYTAQMGDLISDGSETDGRTRITGNDALALITRASELIADYEAAGGAKLNTVLRPSVNGQGKF